MKEHELRKLLKPYGLTIVRSRSGHLKIYQGATQVASHSATPSDPRSWLNLRAQLRRAGIPIK